MKLQRKYKPELIVSKDATRYILEQVMVDLYEGEPVCVATDGRRIVIVPCEIEDVREIGCLSPQVFKTARAAQSIKNKSKSIPAVPVLDIEADVEQVIVKNGIKTVVFKRQDYGRDYPKYKQAIPTGKPRVTISINPKLLWELAQAMGAEDGVTLEIHEQDNGIDTAIGVVPNNSASNKARAVLMPMRMS